jgi:hypothetical protein
MLKPSRILALLCLPMLFSAACVSAFRVHHITDKQKLDGIPFYAKTARCVQTSVYLYPYYRITFQTLSGDKVLGTLSVALNAAAYRSSDTQGFLGILRKKPPLSDDDIAKVADYWSKMEAASEDPYSRVGQNASATQFLISNTASVKVLVDYSNEYSLNARTPLAGSVKADYKLNEDGSLNETSAEVQDQTLATIAGLFPISDLIKSAAGVATKAAAALAPDAPSTVVFQATVEKRALKISYSRALDFGTGCSVAAAISPGSSNDITIEDVGPDTPAPKDDKSSSINVSGKITLPTPAPSKPGAGTQPATTNPPPKAPGKQ